MCKCLWGTSAKRTGVCFLLGIDTFTVVMSTRSEKIEVIPAWIHKLPTFTTNEKMARFGKIPNLAAKIWKLYILPARFEKF